jgi:hypothetical protein
VGKALSIAALIIGVVALVVAIGFGIWQTLFNRKVEQQLLGSGTTLLEVSWTWSGNYDLVHCLLQAREIPLSNVVIRFGHKRKSIGRLSPWEIKTADFADVGRGEKWTVTFLDPNRKLHKESYQIWGNEVELFG